MIGQHVSHYEILEKLGEGGMGEVYLAEDAELERKVALKFLPLHYTVGADVKTRFRREAKSAAALNHPNIVTIHEIGEHEGRAFIAMEYVRGGSLRDWMNAQRSRSAAELLDDVFAITLQLCAGLEAAHAAGIVHRDLKPDNIMRTADGVVKILDFGLAKRQGASKLTEESSTLGTTRYMSPEQCEGAQVDHRADIWATGVILYEMLTGRAPFDGEYDSAVMYAIVNEDPEPVARYKAGVPAGIQRAIDKALDKDRGHRYQHIDDLATDVRREKRASSSGITVAEPGRPRSRAAPKGWLLTSSMLLLAVLAIAAFLSLPRTPKPPIEHEQITYGGDADSPMVSPDGQFVAYASGKLGKKRLMLADLANGQSLQLAPEHWFYTSLEWAPNSAELLFWGANDTMRFGSYLVPRLGGEVRRLSTAGHTTWSPSGEYIAYAGANWGGVNFRHAPTNGFAGWLNLDGRFQMISSLAWSPRGDRVLVTTTDGQSNAIRAISVDGSEQHVVVEEDATLFSPRWSADGSAIYYLREVGRTKDLVKIRISKHTAEPAGAPEVLISGIEAGAVFSITPDNKRLFYTREVRYSNLWRLETGTQEQAYPVQLTRGTEARISPSISPDGQSIAYSLSKGPVAEIHVLPLEGGKERRLTHMRKFTTWPAWSPDGKQIAFSAEKDGAMRIWSIQAQGGTPSMFPDAVASTEAALVSWAPGAEILYRTPDLRNFNVVNPQTRLERPLVKNPEFGWIQGVRYSQSATQLALSRSSQFSSTNPGLWQMALPDSTDNFIYKSSEFQLLSWSHDDRWIYGIDANRSPTEVVKISVEDGAVETVARLPAEQLDGVSITPDGRQIVYAAHERTANVWAMTHFDPDQELAEPLDIPEPLVMRQFRFWREGIDLWSQRKRDEAIDVYRKGLELNPAHFGLIIQLAVALRRLDRHADSERVYRDGLDALPDHPGLLNGLAWRLNSQNKIDEAKAAFERGLEKAKKSGYMQNGLLNGLRSVAIKRQDYVAARRHLEAYLELKLRPRDMIFAHRNLGALHILGGDSTAALVHLNRALDIDSTVASTHVHLGYLRLQQDRHAEAVNRALHAVSLDSGFASHNLAAWALAVKDTDLDLGTVLAEKALAAKPENWQQTATSYPFFAIPEHTLGLLHFKASRYGKAVDFLEQAARFAPERERIRQDLARAKTALEERR